MRILIDYDDTIMENRVISKHKIRLLEKALKDGHVVRIYTGRTGHSVKAAERRLKKHGLNIKVIGGRQRYDYFIDSQAGGWKLLKKVLKGEKRR